METLAREFPDVFAFPKYTTTKPRNEDALYRVDAPEVRRPVCAWGGDALI
jgi:hypothetical protein